MTGTLTSNEQVMASKILQSYLNSFPRKLGQNIKNIDIRYAILY